MVPDSRLVKCRQSRICRFMKSCYHLSPVGGLPWSMLRCQGKFLMKNKKKAKPKKQATPENANVVVGPNGGKLWCLELEMIRCFRTNTAQINAMHCTCFLILSQMFLCTIVHEWLVSWATFCQRLAFTFHTNGSVNPWPMGYSPLGAASLPKCAGGLEEPADTRAERRGEALHDSRFTRHTLHIFETGSKNLSRSLVSWRHSKITRKDPEDSHLKIEAFIYINHPL